jgi:hypothetical protein
VTAGMATQTPAQPAPPPQGVQRDNGPRASIVARTLRGDRWWVQPLVIAIGFTAFVVYATWAAFNHPLVVDNGAPHRIFYANPYLSPFYSPCFTDGCPSTISWGAVDFWHWLSPALYVLIFPLSFRATCYYYRKAYYRSFWLSPPACAVSEPHSTYTGETRFPLLVQNIHRYTWYFAVIFAGILTWDAVESFIYTDSTGTHFFLGVGTFVLVVNAVLILGYTLGCHSCRHITSGRINSFSKHPVRYRWWTFVSALNRKHMQWAWASLVWVGIADGYIRLVSNGTITDFHHIF